MADKGGQEQQSGSHVRSALKGLGSTEQPGASSGGSGQFGEHAGPVDKPLRKELRLFGPNNLDRAVFCRQLAMMIEVGIPLVRALNMLRVRTPHPKLAAAVGRVTKQVEAGQSVSQAMTEDEKAFSPLVCNIVRVGEVGGILEGSLVRLAEIMESKTDISRKITAAMWYPVSALVVAVALVILILVKAVPQFVAVYETSGEALPLPTRIVIMASEFVTNNLYLGIGLAAVLLIGGRFYLTTPGGKRLWSWIALKLWIVGRVTKKIAVARFSRTLGGLLTAGVPLTECLSIAADTNDNVIISDTLRDVHDSVERGEKIAGPLSKGSTIPALVVDMISIGEETGTLDRMLERVADIYEADVDATLNGLSAMIQPALVVVLGGVVIFIALSVMLPYFNLINVV